MSDLPIDSKTIPVFDVPDVFRITSEHPDIDFILHNAGIQRGAKFHEPDSLDLTALTTELTTNYTSVLYVLKYALPFLVSKASAEMEGSGGRGEGRNNKTAAIGLMTSGLAILPMTRCGPYSASKAAVHQLVYALRVQLEKTNVKVIEILPPSVQSE